MNGMHSQLIGGREEWNAESRGQESEDFQAKDGFLFTRPFEWEMLSSLWSSGEYFLTKKVDGHDNGHVQSVLAQQVEDQQLDELEEEHD
jgi:hypothetical protein